MMSEILFREPQVFKLFLFIFFQDNILKFID